MPRHSPIPALPLLVAAAATCARADIVTPGSGGPSFEVRDGGSANITIAPPAAAPSAAAPGLDHLATGHAVQTRVWTLVDPDTVDQTIVSIQSQFFWTATTTTGQGEPAAPAPGRAATRIDLSAPTTAATTAAAAGAQTPASSPDLPGVRVVAIPAPSAAAVLALIAIISPRRRR